MKKNIFYASILQNYKSVTIFIYLTNLKHNIINAFII